MKVKCYMVIVGEQCNEIFGPDSDWAEIFFDCCYCLGSLAKPPTVHAVPIRVEVWPVALPLDVYAKIHWSNFTVGQTSEQSVRDQI